MQHNINLSVPRQGDRNELLAKVAKRAERAQLLVYYIYNIFNIARIIDNYAEWDTCIDTPQNNIVISCTMHMHT